MSPPPIPRKKTSGFLVSAFAVPVYTVFLLSLASAIRNAALPPASQVTTPDVAPPPAAAQPSLDPDTPNPDDWSLDDIESAVTAALPDATRATVAIRSFHRDPENPRAGNLAIGGGVIISPDGLVLTAGHVVDQPGQKVVVTMHDGRERSATSLGISLYSDAGMVKIAGVDDLPFAQLAGGSATPDVGDWTFALGHPGGLDEERGIVLRVGRVLDVDPFTIRTSNTLLGGDSGGPLFDLDGRVIGIHSRISDQTDDNYHVSIPAFTRHWTALASGSTLGHSEGWHGLVTLDDDDRVIVARVFPDAASYLHVRPGDQVTHLNGEPVVSSDIFDAMANEYPPGSTVTLDLVRDGNPTTVDITLEDTPWADW